MRGDEVLLSSTAITVSTTKEVKSGATKYPASLT